MAKHLVKHLRIEDVQAKCGGVNASTIYRWIYQKHFPRAIKLGHRVSLWDESEIDAWIEARKVESCPAMPHMATS